ncbi:alpha/beta hydrolase [Acinetobacter stercoris]|nr:alpha/beta fold hydrolase [Acinetobacter stercoris]
MKKIWIDIEEYKIQADLYQPSPTDRNHIIIMAHGLGGEKSCGLTPFVQFYLSLGYDVCVFDHRGFGESSGAIKNLVDKNSQIQDWKTVIHHLKEHYSYSEKHMILWGYSFSSAHILMLASQTEYKGIISNFPHVDGLASLKLYPKKYLLVATLLSLIDLTLAPFGKVKTMPVVNKNRFAILAGQDCYRGYLSIIPKNIQWDNRVPARIIAYIGFYRPTIYVHKIESSVLVLAAENDSLIPLSATQKMAKKIKNGQYHEITCGHFDLFHEPYHRQILQLHQQFLASL